MENKEPKSIMVKIFGRDYPFKATTDEIVLRKRLNKSIRR